jgi:hypothetical protein
MSPATVSGGMAKTSKSDVQSAFHVNMGIRRSVIPGARSLRIVTTKLIPVSVEPNPASVTAHIQ